MAKLGILILFLLMLPIIGIPITPAIYTENHNIAKVDYSNYNNIIKYLASQEHLDLSNKSIYYKLFYGGRPIEIKYPSPLHDKLAEVPTVDIHFGAYIRDRGWIELPFIPYSLYMKTVGGGYYKLDKIVTNSTIIKIRLPPYLPIETNPRQETPSFARGSREWFIVYIELEENISIPIYVFIHGSMENYLLYSYSTIVSDTLNGWDTYFRTPSLDLLLKYMRTDVVAANNIIKLVKDVQNMPIHYNNIRIDLVCPQGNYICRLPGNYSIVAIDDTIKYTELWPSIVLLEKPFPTELWSSLIGFRESIRMRTNEENTLYIRFIWPGQEYLKILSPHITGLGLVIKVTPLKKTYENQVLMLSIGGGWPIYRVIPGYATSIIVCRKPLDLKKEDLNESFPIGIKINGETSIEWSISVRVYVDYVLNKTFYKDSFKASLTLAPFYPLSSPRMFNHIVLRRSHNYTYRYLILMPLLSGGYFNNYTMLFANENYSIKMKLRLLNSINVPYYRFKVRVCIGSHCMESLVFLNTSISEISFRGELTRSFADEVLGYTRSAASIPVALSIEPLDIPREEKIDLALWFTGVEPIILNVVPIVSGYASKPHIAVIQSTLFRGKHLLLGGEYKDIVSMVMASQIIESSGSTNIFYPVLFIARFGATSIRRGSINSFISMSMQPLITVWSDEEPGADNYYTKFKKLGITEISLELRLSGERSISYNMYTYICDQGVGTYLPKERCMKSKVLTLILDHIVSAIGNILELFGSFFKGLERFSAYTSILISGYGLLRSSLLNGVYVNTHNGVIKVRYTVSPFNPLPTDQGITVAGGIIHYIYSHGGLYVRGTFSISVRARIDSGTIVEYRFGYSFKIRSPM